jgi:hypothetical protein
MPMSADIRETLMQREPGAAIAQALDTLLSHDRYLFEVNANERSLTHRFGLYLQDGLPDWHVDCEYNRNGLDPKRYLPLLELMQRLEVHGDVSDTEGKTAFPDVIAHHRSTTDNYLVMEFKKSTSQVTDEVDFEKLRAYKRDPRLQYRFAIFIELQVGDEPAVARVEWVD